MPESRCYSNLAERFQAGLVAIPAGSDGKRLRGFARSCLDRDSVDLTQRNHVDCPVVDLGLLGLS